MTKRKGHRRSNEIGILLRTRGGDGKWVEKARAQKLIHFLVSQPFSVHECFSQSPLAYQSLLYLT